MKDWIEKAENLTIRPGPDIQKLSVAAKRMVFQRMVAGFNKSILPAGASCSKATSCFFLAHFKTKSVCKTGINYDDAKQYDRSQT